MVMRVGILGLSDGNGHPFSFSAIVNGYSEKYFAESGWPVIHDYLKGHKAEDFGFEGVKVTHAWTQDLAITQRLCRASMIPTAVEDPRQMLGQVDAIIVARDDWETHYPLSKPFLEAGLPVFVDKPLSLNIDELAYFTPYLERGKLMSCSGLRFAPELDSIGTLGSVRYVSGAVVLNWQRYGVHLLDAVFNILPARPLSIARHPARHEAFTLAMDDGSIFSINAIGPGPKTFHLDFYGDQRHLHVDLHDNFTAFRRTLGRFFKMCHDGQPPIAPEDTLDVMRVLMAGLSANVGGEHVCITDSVPRKSI